MAEPRSKGSLVRYFCTAGNGMEHFLKDEVKKKLTAEDVCQMPGKVLFSSSAGIDRVTELKAAERLFLLLKQDEPLHLSAHTSPGKVRWSNHLYDLFYAIQPEDAIKRILMTYTSKVHSKASSVLQSRLLGERNQWTSAVMTWSRLQGELKDRGNTVNTQHTALGVTRRREEGRRDEEEERKCNVESREGKGEQNEENVNWKQRSGEQNGAQTLEKKRKRGDEEEEEERKGAAQDSNNERNLQKEKTPKGEWKREGEEQRGMTVEFNSCRDDDKHGGTSGSEFSHRDNATLGLELSVKSKSRMGDISEGDAVESVQNVKTAEGRDKNLLQPSLIESEPSFVPVSFRISCKCTGSLSRYFSAQEVSRIIGVGLSRLLGWKTDLKNPQLEISVFLSDDFCLLGIPLTRAPLANRSYIKTSGLRSTVAWAMASLAQIQPGFCVVDPMCGVGTILIEAAQEHKTAHFLGVDIDDGQLQKASENLDFAELGNRIHLLKASSLELPLPSASVDAVVCDLPFGRKFDTKTNMAANLPLILAEMERVLCVGGTLVLLLSPQLSCQLKKLLLAQKDAGPTLYQDTRPQTGKQDCRCPSLSSTRQQTLQINQGISSSPTQETGRQSGPQHSSPPPLSSLKQEATFRVSLGLIDGLIHKYVKIDLNSVGESYISE